MDAFDVLGLTPSFDLDLKALEQRYRDLQRALHPDRFAHAAASERRARLARAVNVNDAYRALRDELKRAELLLARHGGTVVQARPDARERSDVRARADARSETENQREVDPAFLMEVMELREQLAETKASGDAAARERLARNVREQQDHTVATLRAALAELASGGKSALERATSALSRLRYYRRFLDEVALLDDAL